MTSKKKRLLQFLAPLGLIAVGVLGFTILTGGKAPPQRRRPPIPVPAVRVLEVETGSLAMIIRGQGTARPLREIQLVSQVGGRVIYTSPSLVDGGAFEEGDTLLRIDPVDYQLALALSESQVKSSESQLKLAEEEAAVAREEWMEALGGNAGSNRRPPPLVVKEPQLKAARARLEADRANLKRALLSLERTVLKAPFSGRVSGKKVDIGQYVTPGQGLATLYSTEAVEIVLPMENEKLFWFHVPGLTPGEAGGAAATVRAEVAGRALSWAGQVVRAEGKLDERTRMINVIVRVDKPYEHRPPLVVGLFVSVDIEGLVLENVVVVPRSALHDGDMVWVAKDNTLLHRRVEVARFMDDRAIIRGGISDGDLVIVTSMDTATDGMKIRVIEESEGTTS